MGDIKAKLDPNAGMRSSAVAPLDPTKEVSQGGSDASVKTYNPEHRDAVQSGAMRPEESYGGGLIRGRGEGPVSASQVAPRAGVAVILSPTLVEQAIMICPAPRNHLLSQSILCGSCKPLYGLLSRKIAMVREDCAKVADTVAAVGEGPIKDMAQRMATAIRALEIDGVKGETGED